MPRRLRLKNALLLELQNNFNSTFSERRLKKVANPSLEILIYEHKSVHFHYQSHINLLNNKMFHFLFVFLFSFIGMGYMQRTSSQKGMNKSFIQSLHYKKRFIQPPRVSKTVIVEGYRKWCPSLCLSYSLKH